MHILIAYCFEYTCSFIFDSTLFLRYNELWSDWLYKMSGYKVSVRFAHLRLIDWLIHYSAFSASKAM